MGIIDSRLVVVMQVEIHFDPSPMIRLRSIAQVVFQVVGLDVTEGVVLSACSSVHCSYQL